MNLKSYVMAPCYFPTPLLEVSSKRFIKEKGGIPPMLMKISLDLRISDELLGVDLTKRKNMLN